MTMLFLARNDDNQTDNNDDIDRAQAIPTSHSVLIALRAMVRNAENLISTRITYATDKHLTFICHNVGSSTSLDVFSFFTKRFRSHYYLSTIM